MFTVAGQTVQDQALVEYLGAGRREYGLQLRRISRHEVGIGSAIRGAKAGARDLNMPQPRLDRGFAHGPEDPFDESAGEQEGDDAEGNGGNGDQRPDPIARQIAKGNP